MKMLPSGVMSSICRSRSHECSMFTQTLSSLFGSLSLEPAGKPTKLSVDVYEPWHSLWTQFGEVPPHCAFVEQVVPDDTPSGNGIGVACGFSTLPHTGQPSLPEQSMSEQSALPLPSLSMVSVQI